MCARRGPRQADSSTSKAAGGTGVGRETQPEGPAGLAGPPRPAGGGLEQ